MTAKEFLIDKGVLSIAEQKDVYTIQKWLDEYAEEVLKIAAKKLKQKLNLAQVEILLQVLLYMAIVQ